MRWDGGGDDGADDGDGVDDDPDDAQRDGYDDGGDPPLREGNSPADFSLPEPFFSLSGFRLAEAAEKLFVDAPDGFRSKGNSTPKGSRRGATGARAGPTRGRGLPLLPGARLRAPFWLRDLFHKILSSEFFWNFWSFRRQVS